MPDASPLPATQPPANVGVLFVHGIGEQQRADTLVQFGEALKGWLERWLAIEGNGVAVVITHADLHQTPAEIPAHATLHITAPGIDSTWILAESWWAASFQAPKYRDLWRWSIEIVPLAVADHFVRRFRLARGASRKVLESALTVVAIALLPIMTLVMTISLIIGILPIPWLRTTILRAQKILLGTVGDSYTLLESSIRGAAMSSRVQHDLRWVTDAAERTVVVAHSQGAAVAHAALQRTAHPPQLLFTFGSGLRKLLVLDVIRGGNRFMIWLLSLGLLLVSLGSVLTYLLIVDPTWRVSWFEVQGIEPRNLYGTGIDLTNLRGIDLTDWRWLTGLGAVAGAIVGLVSTKGPAFARLRGAVPFAVGFALMGMIVEPGYATGPPGVLAFFLLSGGLIAFTSGLLVLKPGETDDDIDKRLELRSHMTWLDRYARADPVPNGPLVSEPSAFVSSLPVSNLGSPLRDHSAYWRNQDQFVPAVASAIADVAGIDLTVTRWDTQRLKWADARRPWRVAWLAASRLLAMVVAIALVLRFRGGLWRVPSDLPSFVRSIFEEFIELIDDVPFLRLASSAGMQSAAAQLLWLASIFLLVWIVYRLFEFVWSWWDRSETLALFRRADYTLLSVPFGSFLAVLTIAIMTSIVFTTFFDRELVRLVGSDQSLRAIKDYGWKGLYQISTGIWAAMLLALSASWTVGWISKMARDWWRWGTVTTDDADIWREGAGYGLLSLTIIAPMSWWMAEVGSAQPRLLPQSELFYMIAAVTIPGLLPVVGWCLFIDSRYGRRLVDRVHDVSASGPFGLWLARGEDGSPVVTAESLGLRAREVLEEWGRIKRPTTTVYRPYTIEVSALASALTSASDGEVPDVLLTLTDTFPYAAVSVAELMLLSDPALARRVLAPHLSTSSRQLRRRVHKLHQATNQPERVSA